MLLSDWILAQLFDPSCHRLNTISNDNDHSTEWSTCSENGWPKLPETGIRYTAAGKCANKSGVMSSTTHGYKKKKKKTAS